MRISLLVALLALAGCATHPPPKFRTGDVAIARHFMRYPQYEGTHVRVTGGLQWRWVRELEGNALRAYEVETVDGQRLAAQEFQLQKCSK